MSGKPLICFAVKEEAVFYGGSANVDVVITGMGGENAFNAVELYLQTHQPAFVLTCGFAGALSSGLPIHSITYSCADTFVLASQLKELGGRQARFVHSSRVLTMAVEKKALLAQSGADVVEMESSVIRELCATVGVPCAIVRIISDAADEDLPLDFNQFMDSKQNLQMGKLVAHVLVYPWKIPRLIRFGRQTREAARHLGDFLNRLLPLA